MHRRELVHPARLERRRVKPLAVPWWRRRRWLADSATGRRAVRRRYSVDANTKKEINRCLLVGVEQRVVVEAANVFCAASVREPHEGEQQRASSPSKSREWLLHCAALVRRYVSTRLTSALPVYCHASATR
jgi:hypothetical protein